MQDNTKVEKKVLEFWLEKKQNKAPGNWRHEASATGTVLALVLSPAQSEYAD